jgi:hypothetical protein
MVFDAFMLEVNVFLIRMLSRVFEVLWIRVEMLLESYQRDAEGVVVTCGCVPMYLMLVRGGRGASRGSSQESTTFSMRSHQLLEIEVVDPW